MQLDDKKRNILIQILAIVGIALSVELAIIYYNANYVRYSLSSFCSINDFIDCDGAARTTMSQFWGIPLAYWGMFLYLTILFLTVVNWLKGFKFLKFLEVFKNRTAYISTFGLISFVISMILACKSIFEINKLCLLCLITYFIDLTIAITASNSSIKALVNNLKITALDFIDGAKKYPKTCIILVLAAITFVSYSNITYNFVPHMKRGRSIMKYKNMKHNPYRVKGNVLGNPNGDVVIELYSDYVCPLCYVHNIMIHKAAKEFTNIKVIHHNFPFDKECNPYINVSMHPNACYMARGALAAKKQGNYWEMSSLLYENKPKDVDSMMKLAKKLKFDTNKFETDFESNEITEELNQEIKDAKKYEIDATPTMIINGKKIVGVRPYNELEKVLIEYGAKKK